MKYPRGHVALERALSKLGLASRSEAQRLIRAGQVTVNGQVRSNPLDGVRPEQDRIEVAGSVAAARTWRTIAFHKPRGTVTTRRDPEGRKTVFDVLGAEAEGLVAVGRLDLATAGLLLLTTDTQLAERLTNPKHGVVRRYVVTAKGEVSDDDCARLVQGVSDPAPRSESSPTASTYAPAARVASPRVTSRDVLRASTARVRKRSQRETHLIVELTEGRNREIRRLFAAIGRPVTRLLRVAYGPIELGTLQPGEWRELTRDAFSRR